MERRGTAVTVKQELEPYRQLVFAIANRAWMDIKDFLRFRNRSNITKETLYRLDRDYRTSIHFFTVPYNVGLYMETSYFAYLLNQLGHDEGTGIAQKAKARCLEIERTLNEEHNTQSKEEENHGKQVRRSNGIR